MATTKQWLDNQKWADLAFVLEFEGINLVVHTAGKGSISTAWAGTDWTVYKAGLQIAGKIEDKIKPFCGDFDPQSMTFTIVDTDGVALSAIFGVGAGSRCHLSADVDCDDTTIQIDAATPIFVADQIVYCGLEAIKVSAGYTEGHLDGSTRGYFTSLETSAPGRRGSAHKIDVDTTFKPIVSSVPPTHYNRIVSLWVTHWENGAWATRANSRRLWSGRIKEWGEEGDGRIAIAATDIREGLQKTLLADQLRGVLSRGEWVRAQHTAITITLRQTVASTGVVTEFTDEAELSTLVDAYATHEEVAAAIQAQFDAWVSDGLWLGGTLDIRLKGDGFYELVFMGAAANTYTLSIGLYSTMWSMLGLLGDGFVYAAAANGWEVAVLTMAFGREDGELYYCRNVSPRLYLGAITEGDKFSVAYSTGTWHDQPGATSPYGAVDGFMLVGGILYAVTESSGEFTVVYRVSDSRFPASMLAAGDAQESDQPDVKQIWYSEGPVGEVLYEIAVSTGTTDHNVATFDCLPLSMGCAMPYAALDRSSWLGLGEDTFLLMLEEPRGFKDILESALSVRNAHLVFRDGAIHVGRGIGATSSTEAVATLDESNKAQDIRGGGELAPERIRASYGTDGVINRITLKYCRNFGGKDYAREVVVNHLPSQTDNGQTRGVTIEADGFYGTGSDDPVVQAWVADVAANALAYCSSAWATVSRSFDFGLVTSLYPGCTCLLTDYALVDPATGTRGVTSKAVWCLSVAFDWGTGVGTVELCLAPNAPRVRVWAPSAMVDHAATNGGWDAENYVLTLTEHQYSDSTQATDPSRFVYGDAIHVVELSPSNPDAPQEWFTQIEAVDGAGALLTSDLSGWDSTKHYIIERDDSGTVSAANLLESSYITVDGHAWGPAPSPITDRVTTPLTYTDLYRKPVNTSDDATEPMSVHKVADIARWLATFWDHGSSPILVNEMWATARSAAACTGKLIYGPIRLPYIQTDRQWIASVLSYTPDNETGTCTVTVTSSSAKPTGASADALVWSGLTSSVDLVVTDEAYAWNDTPAFYPTQTNASRRGGSLTANLETWITVTVAVTGDADFYLRGLILREVPL